METDNILCKYSKYNTLGYEITSVPTFINCLTNEYDQILLLFEKNMEFPREESDEFVEKEADLTGSPLSTDLSSAVKNLSLININPVTNNWLKDEEHYIPIAIEKARHFVALYNLTKRSLNVDAVFCISDGRDSKRTVLVGSANLENISDGFTTHIMGHFSRKNPQVDIRNFINEHNQIATSHFHQPFKTTERVDCEYEILGPRVKQSKDLPLGSIFLKVSWDNSSYKVQTPYETHLEVESLVGHYESVAHPLYYQLQYLQNCIALIETYQKYTFEGSKIEVPQNIYRKINKISVPEQIEKFLFDGYFEKRQFRDSEIDKSFEAACIGTIDREPEDFTDQLWNILINVESYEELRDSLNNVYEKISFGDFLPYISPNNPTSIAQLIRNAAQKSLCKMILTDIQPIEVLVELGLQKIFNDFQIVYGQSALPIMDIFTQQNFESEDSKSKKPQFSLVPSAKLNRRQSSINPTNINRKLSFLAQMYTVTDFLLLVEKNLSNFSLYQYGKSIMHLFAQELSKEYCQKTYFKSIDDLSEMQFCTFQIKIPSHMINLADKKAQQWRLTLTSTESNSKNCVEHIFYQSLKPIFPPNIFNSWKIDNSDDDEKYYCIKHLHLVYDFPVLKEVNK